MLRKSSKPLKIADYYKLPVTTWGGGGGTQGWGYTGLRGYIA